MDYFNQIVNRLNAQDLEILAYLSNQSATIALNAKNKQEITSFSGFTDGIFRKVISRLETLCLIESIGEGRAYAYYLTDYGVTALNRMVNEIQAANIK
ncbi:hypothetical protein [Brevibacillus sp. NRS-1366]|uniref:hypothetical protein n=1 Tax=Brevibacillus sp. NRS-1366 TaxID=3233899 RepID=UPI003D1CEAE2